MPSSQQMAHLVCENAGSFGGMIITEGRLSDTATPRRIGDAPAISAPGQPPVDVGVDETIAGCQLVEQVASVENLEWTEDAILQTSIPLERSSSNVVDLGRRIEARRAAQDAPFWTRVESIPWPL